MKPEDVKFLKTLLVDIVEQEQVKLIGIAEFAGAKEEDMALIREKTRKDVERIKQIDELYYGG